MVAENCSGGGGAASLRYGMCTFLKKPHFSEASSQCGCVLSPYGCDLHVKHMCY